MNFHSKSSQDRFLFERFFSGKRRGVFVDIGAYDGKKFNNTLFFEQTMGWRGLCIEPQSKPFKELAANRATHCEQVCVSNVEGEADFLECTSGAGDTLLSGLTATIDSGHAERMKAGSANTRILKVPVVKLGSLLEKHGLFDIDYCSIDAEGAELSILSGLDFRKFKISLLTIRNNQGDDRVAEFMAGKGYDFVARIDQDLVFKHHSVKPLPLVSIICAVWHGDPLRREMLRGHRENLDRQSVPVSVIYVFDGGDTPPDWLEGRIVTVKEPLSMYQAWNVALSLVGTPLVMNLNLDDRLAVNAVELMQNTLLAQGATIVGGDWKICYSQAETDAVGACYDAHQVPIVPDWPPAPGTLTRLGSGTGNRGTLGPAAMWRMDAHIGLPRYPWRFSDGSLIRTIGDGIWTYVLSQHKKKQVRIPLIIGNYHSHPADQAEFRKQPEDEHALLSRIGSTIL